MTLLDRRPSHARRVRRLRLARLPAPTPKGTVMLEMWSVYDHPRDYPGSFVARRFEVTAGEATVTAEVRVAATLEAVREQLPAGLMPLPRDEHDDPVIVETWI